MPRDRHILRLLYLHRMLTIDQITAISFDSARRAQARMLELTDMNLVRRVRPPRVGGGTYPTRYALQFTGAELMYATYGHAAPRPAAHDYRFKALMESPKLDHLLGINDFFTDLIAYARRHPDRMTGWDGRPGGLTLWMPERAADDAVNEAFPMGDRVRPDAYGCFEADGRVVRFALEHDTGTEPLATLVKKVVDKYDTIRDPFGIVLFWLHSSQREKRLRTLLAEKRPYDTLAKIVATAARDVDHPDGAAGPVWTLAAHRVKDPDPYTREYKPDPLPPPEEGTGTRVRLHQLPERGYRDDHVHHPDVPYHQAARADRPLTYHHAPPDGAP